MGRLRVFAIAGILLGFVAAELASQQIMGPVRGFLPAGGRRLNREVPFHVPQITSVPLSAEPRKKLIREPLFPLRVQPPAAAPEGTNFFLDGSTEVVSTGQPPIVLASFAGIPRTSSFPPDPVIAAGPRHLVAAVNREIRIFEKNGTLLQVYSAAAWFNAVVPGCAPYDPRVLFDHFAGRFIMLWHHYGFQPNVSNYLLSVSETDDPTGNWSEWALPGDVTNSVPSGTWADNGCLGFDSLAVYIVSNQYTFPPGLQPAGVRVRIIPRTLLYSGQGGDLTWTDFSLGGAFCVRPAVVHGQADAGYLLEVPDPLPVSTSVVLYRIENPGSNPTISSSLVPVTEFRRAPDAGQAGGDAPLDCRRSYLHSEVHWLNGSLYAAFSVASPGSPEFSSLRYLRISTSTRTATEDITYGSPGFWYFYPAVAVDRDGNVAISFARSGNQEFAGSYFTWRLATDVPGLRPSVVVQPGWASYQQRDSTNFNRWGDYSGAAIDPADGHTFWLAGEYAEGPNIWGTWITSARLVPYAAPKLVIDDPLLNFGMADVPGAPVQASVIVRNGGAQPLIISGAQASSALFTVVDPPSWPVSLALYDSLPMRVVFSPLDTGSVSALLLVTSNDPETPSAAIALQGTGVRIASAVPGVIYAVQVTRSSEEFLYFLNESGEIRSVTPLNIPGLQALSVGAWNARMYGAAQANHGTRIDWIDGSDGRQYSSPSFGIHGVGALCAFDRDTFFCGTDTGSIYRYIPSTSEVTLIGERRGVGFSGFARSGADRLWAMASFPPVNDTLYSLDVRTGAVFPVGTTGFKVRTTSFCRASDGGLLALVDNSLVRIDTSTGNGSFKAYIALEGLRAIAAGQPSTGVGGDGSARSPFVFALGQNFPNPFNPETRIRYQLPAAGDVRLIVYDLLGRRVATLVDERKAAGSHEVLLNASRFASGVYLYRLTAGDFSRTRKLVVLR